MSRYCPTSDSLEESLLPNILEHVHNELWLITPVHENSRTPHQHCLWEEVKTAPKSSSSQAETRNRLGINKCTWWLGKCKRYRNDRQTFYSMYHIAPNSMYYRAMLGEYGSEISIDKRESKRLPRPLYVHQLWDRRESNFSYVWLFEVCRDILELCHMRDNM